MSKIKVGFIGLGNRGGMYYEFARKHDDICEIVSVCDFIAEQQLSRFTNRDVPHIYTNTDDFFNDKLELDLLCISSMDKYHYNDAKRAIDLGYNLLLEKPIACKLEEVLELQALAKEKGVKVVICHVLRYTMFYKEIKRLITEGTLGQIININCTENVGYWHQCHSYVRGNWHNVEETAPQILTKCSHDLDIIQWLMDKKVNYVSSFGALNFFKKENKPSESTYRCGTCPLGYNCDFNAYRFYLKNPGWLIPFMGTNQTEETIKAYLDKSVFGHCAFDMDNDTVDHQVVNILFDDNTTATLTLNAFSNKCYRDIKVYGTKADLVANFEEKKIHVELFNDEVIDIDLTKLTDDFSGHGGGDAVMFKELLTYLQTGEKTDSLTLLDDSVISHRMAFLSEESRIEKGSPKKVY